MLASTPHLSFSTSKSDGAGGISLGSWLPSRSSDPARLPDPFGKGIIDEGLAPVTNVA